MATEQTISTFELMRAKFTEMQEKIITLEKEKEADRLLIQKLKSFGRSAQNGPGMSQQVNDAYTDCCEVEFEKVEEYKKRLSTALIWLQNAADHLQFLEALNRMWNGEPQTNKKPLVTEVSSKQIYEFLHSNEESKWTDQVRPDFPILEGLLEEIRNYGKKKRELDPFEKITQRIDSSNRESESKEEFEVEYEQENQDSAVPDSAVPQQKDNLPNDVANEPCIDQSMIDEAFRDNDDQNSESKTTKKDVIRPRCIQKKSIRSTNEKTFLSPQQSVDELQKKIECLENANDEYLRLNEKYVSKILTLQLNRHYCSKGPTYFGFSILFHEKDKNYLIRLSSGNHPYFTDVIYSIESDLAKALAKFKKVEIVTIPSKEKNVQYIDMEQYALHTKYSKSSNSIKLVFEEEKNTRQLELFKNASRRYPQYQESIQKIMKYANEMLMNQKYDEHLQINFSDDESDDE